MVMCWPLRSGMILEDIRRTYPAQSIALHRQRLHYGCEHSTVARTSASFRPQASKISLDAVRQQHGNEERHRISSCPMLARREHVSNACRETMASGGKHSTGKWHSLILAVHVLWAARTHAGAAGADCAGALAPSAGGPDAASAIAGAALALPHMHRRLRT
jgi:hypothetical protein